METKIKKISSKVVREPQDYTQCFNGGDYREIRYTYLLETPSGFKKEFNVYWSSADFDYCELSGRYVDTVGVSVIDYDNETEIFHLYVNKSKIERHFNSARIVYNHIDITLDEFLVLIS